MDANASSSHSHPHGGTGSQIRSRVTVVCAECKRLKLKCDRRTPCSSCLKRDTVPRCTYSAAAAEKIDVQSLHNRVLILEAQLSQFTAGRMKLSSQDLDHALLAVGSSGSSVLVPVDDVAGVWLEHLDLGRNCGVDFQPAFLGTSNESESHDRRDHARPEVSPCSRGDSVHSSPHPASAAVSSPLSLPGLHSSPPSVTPALLALLPSARQRPILLDVLSSVLRMHPSLNFPHFRARITAMFIDGSSPGEIGIGPSRADHTERPTLTFFAAVTAGFALAIRCSSGHAYTSQTPASPAPCSFPSVSSLLTLSAQVLNLVEDTMPYDLDFLHALILRCLCMLHDGMPRVSQAVFTMVGKMVNIARLMGLARDPDEFTCGPAAKYSLWEAEMRRRMWWDIFYYDLFISDCMGFTPLIPDDQHTCRMPADVDEDAFVPKSAALPQPVDQLGASNFSYFVQKCKLAQLVKNMKKRVCHDPSSLSCPTSLPSEPSLEAASQAEFEIHQYLLDLPQAFKLDIDADPADHTCTSSITLPPPLASEMPPPHLIIQRCELVSIAHQLVLKIFHPFLRRINVRPPDNAMTASINASHAIIQASRVAQGVWQRQRGGGTGGYLSAATNSIPSSHGVFYPFARQLFDAAVVAAHIVIQAPQSIVAKVALDDVRVALDVLRDPNIATGRGRASSRGGVEGCPSEAVTIVEMMLRKAELAKRNHVPVTAGIKRKHEEVEDNITTGFWLPYVGASVATESAPNGSGVTGVTPVHGSPRAKAADKPFAPENQPHHQTLQHRVSAASLSTRERDKERKYPTLGIRTPVNTGSVSDLKSPGGTSHRRDSSVSSQQQPGSDQNNYATSTSTAGLLTPTLAPEANPSPTGEFSVSAPYGIEDSPMVDMNVSPSTSRFPPPPPHAAHSYPAHHSFQPSTPSGSHHHHHHHHQPMYDSGSYSSEPRRQTSFYVPYQPSVPPPPHAGFRGVGGHGPGAPPHPHPHAPQQAQPHDLDMMGLLPNQGAADASTADMPRATTKQEEGAERRERHHPSSFAGPGPEGWNNPGVTRYAAGQVPWNSGYNY